jgi:hypothetical protein
MKQIFLALMVAAMVGGDCLAGTPGVYNPYGIVIMPSTPRAGDAFIVRWDATDCFDIGDVRAAFQNGRDIIVGVEYVPGPPTPGCTGTPVRREWTIGPFPAGNYTFNFLGFVWFAPQLSWILAEVPLRIAPIPAVALPAPEVVPAMSWLSQLAMVLLVLAMTVFATSSSGRGSTKRR